MNKNSQQTITIYDMPRRVRNGFESLCPLRTQAAVEGGIITSEVGMPITMSFPQWDKPIAVFPLRIPRKNKFPDHVYGKAEIGDAFSAFQSRDVALPPVGSTTLLQPQVTPEQRIIIDLFQTVRADGVWIFYVPMPIGSAVTLRIYPPEIDDSTETKGIIWRPADHPAVAVAVPHSNDLAQLLLESPRPGQSGLAIKIKVLDDNTTSNVETPLDLVALQATMNVWCTGLKPNEASLNLPAINHLPVTLPNPVNYINNCADTEQTLNPVEISGDTATTTIHTVDSPQVKENVEAEKPIINISQNPKRKVRNQQGTVATRWFPFQLESLPITDRSWKTFVINPARLNLKGENISLAYRRNVWVTGNKAVGYMTGIEIKFKVTRSPAISGVIEVQDSLNSSSRYLVCFGENKDIPIQFTKFNSFLPFDRPRHYNNEYLRTDEAVYTGRWRLLTANRTAEQSDLQVELLIHAGEVSFDVSTKPRSAVPVNLELYNAIESIINPEPVLINNCSSLESIVPLPALTPYLGNVEDQSFESEELAQDDFATEIYRQNIPVGTVIPLSLNLAVLPDLSGAGGLSTIAEKFQRHAHIIPSQAGAYGPEIGEVTVVTRLPATTTGHLEFVAIPGDQNEDAAVRALGLASILSLAGSAVKAIGGPNIANFLNAGMNVMNTVTDIVGSKNSIKQQLESISSNIPVSRFVQLLKPILENEVQDPTFGSLLLRARDVIDYKGDPVDEIPISIFSKLLNPAVERNLFDREVTPSLTIQPGIFVPRNRLSFILEYFLQNDQTFIPNSFQNLNFIKFLISIQNNTGHLDVQSVLDLSLNDELINQYNTIFQQYFDPEIQSPTEFPSLNHYGSATE